MIITDQKICSSQHHSSTHDRTKEWHFYCQEIVLGRDPKRRRMIPDKDSHSIDEDMCNIFTAPGCLIIDMRQPNEIAQDLMPINNDSWMQAALAMSASIDEVSLIIQKNSSSYISSMDTFEICFQDNMSSKSEYSISNNDRSILETTVASFTAGMAKQIESLRQTVVVEGDHPFMENGEIIDTAKSGQCWASGPIGYRAGIASCLAQRLKTEVMDPMSNLHLQRERKNKNILFSSNGASTIAQNPFQTFRQEAKKAFQRSLPPAPWELGQHDSDQDHQEHQQEREEFLNIYYQENRSEPITAPSYKKLIEMTVPPSSLRQIDTTPFQIFSQKEDITDTGDEFEQEDPISQPLNKLHTSRSLSQNDHVVPPIQEESTIKQLQQESAALIATYQHSDLEGVQNVERSMMEITHLLSRFTDLISEQQENIIMVHDQALKSKENVDKGQNQLVDAATRGEKSTHPMATFIVVMALLLLFFNWIFP